MKKVFAILMAMAMIVSACVALTVSSSAGTVESTDPAVNATTVTVTPTTGDDVELTATNKTMTAGSGTIAYEPTTGILTMTNATGIKKVAANGSIIVELVGENVVDGFGTNNAFWVSNNVKATETGGDDTQYQADLTVRGSGKLTVNGDQWIFGTQMGNITITGDATVTIYGTSNHIHMSASPEFENLAMTVSGNAKVFAYGKDGVASGPVIRIIKKDQTLIVKDNAEITVDIQENKTNWASGIVVPNFEMYGGKVKIVNKSTTVDSITGLDLQNGSKGAIFAGGTIEIEVCSKQRPHSMFFKNLDETVTYPIQFKGTNITATTDLTTEGNANQGHFKFQGKSVVNVTVSGGNLNFTAKNETIQALFNCDPQVNVKVTGGSIKGNAQYLMSTSSANGSSICVTGGSFDFTAAKSILASDKISTEGTTVNFTEGGLNTSAKVLKYVDTNPGTSDLSVALISVAALLSVAAAAVIVARKKVSG